jgi:gamma-glutamyl-gamma-aminobutyraldehyde dehydrogenase
VAQFVTAGAFWNMGENCSASSRLIVHKDVKDELLSLIGKHLKDWNWAIRWIRKPPGRDGQQSAFREGQVVPEYAAEQKLNVVQGGETEQGVFVQPTIVDGVARDNKLFVEEIFGPVLSVTSFETIDEAIELANDTVYGLAASAYTGSLRNALRLSREIRAGVVTVNCFGEGDVTTPFGATKSPDLAGATSRSGRMISTRS